MLDYVFNEYVAPMLGSTVAVRDQMIISNLCSLGHACITRLFPNTIYMIKSRNNSQDIHVHPRWLPVFGSQKIFLSLFIMYMYITQSAYPCKSLQSTAYMYV